MSFNNKTIIWDWNGTLLNDVNACIASMNELLERHNLALIDEDRYKSIFQFPVIKYYEKLGFELGNGVFEKLSSDFIKGYYKHLSGATLHSGTLKTLKDIAKRGYNQVILSAMHQDSLENMLKQYKITSYFNNVMGLDNIYANGKAHLAHEYVARNKISPKDITLIGDTYHDFEVANEIGANCILVSHGHQSKKVLNEIGVQIIDELSQTIEFL